jgi:hypothetical protein
MNDAEAAVAAQMELIARIDQDNRIDNVWEREQLNIIFNRLFPESEKPLQDGVNFFTNQDEDNIHPNNHSTDDAIFYPVADPELGKIKYMVKVFKTGSDQREAINEINLYNLLKRMDSEGIVTIVDTIAYNNQAIIIMEYCESSLWEEIQKGNYPTREQIKNLF